jgi:hypothetical protein
MERGASAPLFFFVKSCILEATRESSVYQAGSADLMQIDTLQRMEN